MSSNIDHEINEKPCGAAWLTRCRDPYLANSAVSAMLRVRSNLTAARLACSVNKLPNVDMMPAISTRRYWRNCRTRLSSYGRPRDSAVGKAVSRGSSYISLKPA